MTRSEHKARLRALVAEQQTRELIPHELREIAEHFEALGDEPQARKARCAADKLAVSRAAELDDLFEPPPQPAQPVASQPAAAPAAPPAAPSRELPDQTLPPEDCGLANVAWILSVLGLVTAGLGSLFGVLLGLVALRLIGGSGGRLRGRDRASSSVVLGLLGLLGYGVAGAIYYPTFQRRQAEASTAECRRRMIALTGEVNKYLSSYGGAPPTLHLPMADLLTATKGDPQLASCPDGHAYKLVIVGGATRARFVGPAGPLLYEASPTDALAAAHQAPQGELAGHVAFSNGTVRLMTAAEFNIAMWRASDAVTKSAGTSGSEGSVSLNQSTLDALEARFKRIYAALTRYAADNGGRLPRRGLEPTVVLDSYGVRTSDWVGPNGRPLRLNPQAMGESLATLKRRSPGGVLVFEVPEPGGSGRPDSIVLEVNGHTGSARAAELDRLR